MAGDFSFYPKGTFAGAFEDSEEFHQNWYGAHLESMGERRLFDLTDGNFSVYRLLCLPTFTAPFMIRVLKRWERGELWIKSTDGTGGYGPGRLTVDGLMPLRKQQYRAFERLLNETEFWSMSTIGPIGGYDGTQLIVEGYHEGRYHVVDRWSRTGTPFFALCSGLVGLLPWPLSTRFDIES